MDTTKLLRLCMQSAAVCTVLLIPACSPPQQAPQPPEPPVVTVQPVQEKEFDSFLEFTGYLKATETQEIRAQVTGYIQKVLFTDGQIVKEGDVLFEIDPEPFEAALKSAEAAIAKAKGDVASAEATLVRTKADLVRAEKLKNTGGTSLEDLDSKKAAKDSAEADLEAKKASVLGAEAQLRKAQFDRKNCLVHSEVKGAGRVSRALLTKGNLVTAGSTLLCKVTSIDPIHAYWDVDEMTSLMYRQLVFDKKEITDPRQKPLRCFIGLKDQEGYPLEGRVVYLAPEIVRTTGTREIYGVFDNKDYRLSPGDSVRVKVESGQTKKFLSVPEIAVGSQQQQKYVMVVEKDKDGKDVAGFRPVTVGPIRTLGSTRWQIIETGLKAGERVIVNGLLRVRPGMPVNAKE